MERLPNSQAQDLTLYRRAGRGRWAVPDKVKAQAVKHIEIMLADVAVSDELKLDAIKTAALLDKIDMEADKIQHDSDFTQLTTAALIEKLEKILPGGAKELFPRLVDNPGIPCKQEAG